MVLKTQLICEYIGVYSTVHVGIHTRAFNDATGPVDTALDLRSKGLPLLIMCRSVKQTSHFMLHLCTQQ